MITERALLLKIGFIISAANHWMSHQRIVFSEFKDKYLSA
jgi:hypothetical protein